MKFLVLNNRSHNIIIDNQNIKSKQFIFKDQFARKNNIKYL